MNTVGVSSATKEKIPEKRPDHAEMFERIIEIYERRHDKMRRAAFDEMNMCWCMCMCRMLSSQAVNVVGCLAHESCA